MPSSTAVVPPVLLEEVAVVAVERLSPSFVRLVLGGPGLADLGVDGPYADQRVKLVLPGPGGVLPRLTGAGADWYATWLALPDAGRGHMRTYTVREVRGSGADTRLVVDVVVHAAPPHGPGATWAAAAQVGDRALLVGPRRGVPFGGREFDPGGADDLLLAGDESALPAVAGILRDLPAATRGTAYVEVPHAADVTTLATPSRVEVVWLPRDGGEVGTRLLPAVRRHTGGRYAWIAGESALVRSLRRTLVGELGWDRDAVCFMGYWRRGVAMRS